MAKKMTIAGVANLLLSTPSMDVSDRKVVDVAQLTTSVTLALGQLFSLVQSEELKRNLMQRNDELRRRMGKAKHVTSGLHIAHTDISVAYYEEGFHLIDGCHRVGHWFETIGAEVPSHVTVTLKMPRTEEEYINLYRAYDSAKAGKSTRDFIYGYMRHLKFADDLTSPLMQSGSFATAFKNLCKGSGFKTQMDVMRAYEQAIRKVDRHNLKAEQVPQGFVQAAITLYHSLSAKAPVVDYVNELILASSQGTPTVSFPTQRVMQEVSNLRDTYGKSSSGEAFTADAAAIVALGFNEFCKVRTGKEAHAFALKAKIVPPARSKLK